MGALSFVSNALPRQKVDRFFRIYTAATETNVYHESCYRCTSMFLATLIPRLTGTTRVAWVEYIVS